MRETWLSENQRLVAQDNFGYDLAAVEAATKKHEAIVTDINAYEERVQAVVAVAHELENENYHDAERIDARLATFFPVVPTIYPFAVHKKFLAPSSCQGFILDKATPYVRFNFTQRLIAK